MDILLPLSVATRTARASKSEPVFIVAPIAWAAKSSVAAEARVALNNILNESCFLLSNDGFEAGDGMIELLMRCREKLVFGTC